MNMRHQFGKLVATMLDLDKNLVPDNLAEAQELILELKRLNDNGVGERKAIEDHYKALLSQMKAKFRTVLTTVYGASSEAMNALFNEADQAAAVAAATEELDAACEEVTGNDPRPPRKKKRKVLPDHLPREEVIHDLSEEEKICKDDGTTLEKIGEDVREEVSITPARIKVIRHITLKYGCPKCHGGVTCACGPKRVIPGSVASPSILASLVTNKYLDHLPLYRQEQMFKRHGVEITRATMAAWIIKTAAAVQPLVNLIKEAILEGKSLQCDETPLLVLKPNGVHLSKKNYMWVMGRAGPPGISPAVLFELGPGRSSGVAARLLGDYPGFVQTDGLKSYDQLPASASGRRLGCMAHVRRQFAKIIKSLKADARGSHPASKIIKIIARLYKIEDEIREGYKNTCEVSYETYRSAIRVERAKGIFKELEDFIASEHLDTSKQSPYGLALTYAQNELPKIKLYLNNGETEIDNNWIENMIRPFALGRKNWLFSDTEHGADASANIYTIVQNAKINGLNVPQYLEEIFIRLPYCETVADYEALLPWNFKW